MAGIGKYTKGKAFKLKSGNSPLFKHIGSPITMNNFGIGQGASPYRNGDEEEEEPKKKKMSLGKKIALTGLAALTSGLDAVYGSGKIMPPGSAQLIKKKDDDEVDKDDPDNKVKDLTGNDDDKDKSEIKVVPVAE